MKKHTCSWILSGSGASTEYCGRPTKYRMGVDDDGNAIRRYDPFCPGHQQLHEQTEKLLAEGRCCRGTDPNDPFKRCGKPIPQWRLDEGDSWCDSCMNQGVE